MNTTCYGLLCSPPWQEHCRRSWRRQARERLSFGAATSSPGAGHLAELSDADAYDEKYGKWRRRTCHPAKAAVHRGVGQANDEHCTLMRRGRLQVVSLRRQARGRADLPHRYNLNNSRIKRLWISSMEDAAILDGFDNLRDSAVVTSTPPPLCRGKADWRSGISATRLFSVMPPHPAWGAWYRPRCVPVRQEAVNAFQPESFTVHLDFDGFSAAGRHMKSGGGGRRRDCNKTAAVTPSCRRKRRARRSTT